MTGAEIAALVASMRTPPQFTLTVVPPAGEPDAVATIRVVGIWLDVRDGTSKARTAGLLQIHRDWPYELVVDRIFARLHTMWCHELHEWFTIDGTPWIDPHPGGGFR